MDTAINSEVVPLKAGLLGSDMFRQVSPKVSAECHVPRTLTDDIIHNVAHAFRDHESSVYVVRYSPSIA